MSLHNYLPVFISSSIIVFFVLKVCGNLLNKDKVKLRSNILIILFATIIVSYSLYNNTKYEHIIISLVVLSLTSIDIYKQDIHKTILSVIIIYFITIFFGLILSVIINYFNLDAININLIFEVIITILSIIFAYFVCLNKFVKNFIVKITNNRLLLNFILVIVTLPMIILDGKYLFLFSNESDAGTILKFACLVYLISISLITSQKLINENEKTKKLLNFMTKYEKKIDSSRIFEHELLNNLLILKSYKNKNTKEFNNILDELIDLNSNKNVSIKNICNLPSGLKEIIYYKLYNLENDDYKIGLTMSKKIENKLNNISHKDYVNLYKVIGILLDNAIEACSKTKDKFLMIDIYKSDNYIFFDISNSFKGKIDLNRINSKGYSSKHKNRGFGLYIANSIISNNKNIELSQSVNNNIFSSKIKLNI